MNTIRNTIGNGIGAGLLALLVACGQPQGQGETGHGHDDAVAREAPKGPHGGRLLEAGDFAVELAIFETGVPPEYRAWPTHDGRPVPLDDVDLEVRLTRLGNVVDEIGFAPQGDFLRGDTLIYEPHSFSVYVRAVYRGATREWRYDSIEGRTSIGEDVAEAFGLETERAGPGVIHDVVSVYGRIVPANGRVSAVRARFDGVIRSVAVAEGDRIDAGDTLATVESNEGLNVYGVTAPIAGVVTRRDAVRGEQTNGRELFTIVDGSVVWAELALFPRHRDRVGAGMAVDLQVTGSAATASGVIDWISPQAARNQSVTARVVLDNADGRLSPGLAVTADIRVAAHEVPLAVRKSGLQAFRDFTVVYAKIGNEYEVRMLDLGREDDTRVEVLGGLEPGTRYVSTNSYLVKADIEKSGASHDH